MQKRIFFSTLMILFSVHSFSKQNIQKQSQHNDFSFKIPAVSNPEKRIQSLKEQWNALHQIPPRLGVRDCFIFLLDALDSRFLKPDEILWTIDLVKTRIIADSTKPSFGNMYWGWTETGGDVGDGNNVEFCVQYGILIKLLFNDRLSTEARASLDDLFAQTLNGIRQTARTDFVHEYLCDALLEFVGFGAGIQEPYCHGRRHQGI